MSPKDDEIQLAEDQLPLSSQFEWFGKHRKYILASVGAGLVLMLVLGLSLGLVLSKTTTGTTTRNDTLDTPVIAKSYLSYVPLTVSSTGPAGKTQSSKMGVYHLTEEYHKNEPVWSRHDGTQKLFYSYNDYWMIGPDPATNRGGVLTAEPAEDKWPQEVKFWKYYNGKKWVSDPLLIVTEYPSSITITSTGRAARNHPKLMGRYDLNPTKVAEMRPVYEKTDSYDYIYYTGNSWMVGDDITDDSGWLSTNGRGKHTVPTSGWKFAADGNWIADPHLRFIQT